MGRGGVPAERVAHSDNTHAFDSVPSRGTAALSAGARTDPYWFDLWPYHASERWYSHQAMLRQKKAGLLLPPDQLIGDSQDALALILGAHRDNSPYTLNTYIALLGVAHGWRTCTAQQSAAFIGDPRLRHQLSHPAALCVRAGFIDTTAPNGWATPAAADMLALYRPATGGAFERITPDLTFAEWLGITGGQPFGGGGHHDRHNVLAAEVALRAGEYTQAAAVLGEAFSTANLLVGEGVGRRPSTSAASADLTVVRPDGLRIAIELTATTSKHFRKKVRRWAKLLAVSPLEHTGLTVIFLLAPSLEMTESDQESMRRAVYREIASACREHPGISIDPTRLRMGVATWREWFPEAHAVADAFFTMHADRPSLVDTYGRLMRWETAEFLHEDSVPYAPADPQAMTAIIANAQALGQSPHWLRASPQGCSDVPPRVLGLGFVPDVLANHLASRGEPPTQQTDRDPYDMSTLTPSRQRSLAQVNVALGRWTTGDVIARAAQGDHRNPLRKIHLKQLLCAQLKVGPTRATKRLQRVASFSGAHVDLTREKLGWLVHNSWRSRRLAAWAETEHVKAAPRGFPWTRL